MAENRPGCQRWPGNIALFLSFSHYKNETQKNETTLGGAADTVSCTPAVVRRAATLHQMVFDDTEAVTTEIPEHSGTYAPWTTGWLCEGGQMDWRTCKQQGLPYDHSMDPYQ